MTIKREAREMAKQWVVRGIVQGNALLLDEPLPLPDGTPVTVIIAPQEEEQERERRQALYARLEAEGFIKVPKTPVNQIRHSPPVTVPGKPLSQIILEERR
jgi:hypothetical protein